MMDKVVAQDTRTNMKEILLQRDQDRKEKLKNLKEEKELSSPDQIKLFHDTFQEHAQNLSDNIKLIEEKKIEQKCLPDHFSKLSKDLQILNRYLSVSTVFLKNFSVRKSLKTIEDIETKIKELEEEFLPKKKFGFKTRKTTKIGEKTSKIVVDEVDAELNKPISFTTISCGFYDKKLEKLKLNSDDIDKQDVELRNLENCTVFLCGNPSTVHISNITRCKIFSGPVSTSVFVENCQDCDLVIACQQLRIHSTKDSRFYIHVTSRAIIEDSQGVKFAPYNLQYENIGKHFEMAGLDRTQNNWNQIDDFNWLASGVPSPNWNEISEEERIKKWPLQF